MYMFAGLTKMVPVQRCKGGSGTSGMSSAPLGLMNDD